MMRLFWVALRQKFCRHRVTGNEIAQCVKCGKVFRFRFVHVHGGKAVK